MTKPIKTTLEWFSPLDKMPEDGSQVLIFPQGFLEYADYLEYKDLITGQKEYSPHFFTYDFDFYPENIKYWAYPIDIEKEFKGD